MCFRSQPLALSLSRYGVNFSTRNDFPRYHPRATARRRSGSTDISRYGLAFHLPDKEFRSGRFMIVVLSLARLGLHVAMQFGPYLHPVIGMSGVWSLRILITQFGGSVFPADFLHWTDCHSRLNCWLNREYRQILYRFSSIWPNVLPRRHRRGRQLLFHLRTVIVTAAVYRGFRSSLAALPLTFRHRAGVSPYTSPYGFAETCVFSKQSVGPLNCNPRRLRR